MTSPAFAPPPTVSILIPAHEHAPYMARCIESIWAQEGIDPATDLEIVVCDDASRDGTAAILREMAARSPVPMVLMENAVNRGVCATLNRCLGRARGHWIAMIASDDMYMPRFVAANLEAARAAGDPMVLQQSGAWRLRPDGHSILTLPPAEPTAPCDIRRRLATGRSYVMAPSIFTSRTLFDAVGGFDEGLSFEDLDFLLRASRVARFAYLREPLVIKRSLPGNLSAVGERFFRDRLACLRKNLGDAPALLHEAVRGDLRRLALAAGRGLDPGLWEDARRMAREFDVPAGALLAPGLRGTAMGLARRAAGPGRLGSLRERLRRRDTAMSPDTRGPA